MSEQNKRTSYHGFDKLGYMLIALGVIILTFMEIGSVDKTTAMYKDVIVSSTAMFIVGMLCVSIVYFVVPKNENAEIGQ